MLDAPDPNSLIFFGAYFFGSNARKKMRPSLLPQKKTRPFFSKQTAMSAIAHHTDIDSPPLANLLALSGFIYQSVCQGGFCNALQALELGGRSKIKMGQIDERAGGAQSRCSVRRFAALSVHRMRNLKMRPV